jgi:hypothetical protein
VSARTGDGIDLLREKIASVQKRSCVIDALMPLTDSTFSLLSRLRSSCTVSERTEEGQISVSLKCKPEEADKITGWLTKAGGSRISVHCETPQIEDARSEDISNGSEGAPLG